jgi:hypothetical protein
LLRGRTSPCASRCFPRPGARKSPRSAIRLESCAEPQQVKPHLRPREVASFQSLGFLSGTRYRCVRATTRISQDSQQFFRSSPPEKRTCVFFKTFFIFYSLSLSLLIYGKYVIYGKRRWLKDFSVPKSTQKSQSMKLCLVIIFRPPSRSSPAITHLIITANACSPIYLCIIRYNISPMPSAV